MPRIIDADEAYKVLTDYYHIRTEIQHKALKEAMERVPTVDAEPVRYGHWSERQSGELYNLPFSVVCCSVCGNPQSTETQYCPCCGANMNVMSAPEYE